MMAFDDDEDFPLADDPARHEFKDAFQPSPSAVDHLKDLFQQAESARRFYESSRMPLSSFNPAPVAPPDRPPTPENVVDEIRRSKKSKRKKRVEGSLDEV